MALVIAGRVVPITRDAGVASNEAEAFPGRVWMGDDGLVAAVTRGHHAGPAGFENAPVVDVGKHLVLPGFIDLHSHLAYATLPLWTEAGRTTPYLHHNNWPARPSYAPSVTWPAYAILTAAPAELLAFAELRALVGGTTAIQGSPPSNRPLDGWMIRNVEDERLGNALPSDRVLASTLTLKTDVLGTRAGQMRAGCSFIYHCAEGQRDSIVTQEYDDLKHTGCLQPQLVLIHACALGPVGFGEWTEPGTLVWSPFSNLWLYGQTTDVPAALARGIRVCIGSDWGPSGTRNVLGELKVASVVSHDRGWGLTPLDLVLMITGHPGDALAQAWGRPVGRLQPGALADVTVIDADAHADPFESVLQATEADVELVVVSGRALYGTAPLMVKAKAVDTSAITVAGRSRTLSMSHFEDPSRPWSFDQVLARLEQVRAHPREEVESARHKAYASALRGEAPGLRLALDMPTGKVPIGGLPKDLGKIEVPPIQPLAHDHDFFLAVKAGGFHGGLLNQLASFYE